MVTHTNANAYVQSINQQGAMATYTTAKPTATMFRYTSVHHPAFAQGWYHENFDKGASAYLGDSLTYTASRNKDVHCDTLIQYDLPGIGNVQYLTDSGTPPASESRWAEVLHPDLQVRYNEIAQIQTGTAYETYSISEDLLSLYAGSGANGAIRKGSGQPHWCDGVALAAIKGVEYTLGGQRMDRHDKHAMYTWHLLNNVNVPFKMMGLAESRENNDYELKTDSMAFQRKYAPLCFTFCRHPSMAIPLISNIYNNLVINVDLEPFHALIKNYSGAGNSAGGTVNQVIPHVTTLAANFVAGPGQLSASGYITDSKIISDLAAISGGSASGKQFYTFVRKNEDTLAASRSRGRNLACAQDAATSALGSTVLTATNLAQTQCPVAVVSRVFFLGPQERYAFASNAHCQVVEACQRIKSQITNQPSYTFRTDTLQNSCSSLYVVPLYRRQLACNEHFDYGGAYDYMRQRSFPAISSIKFTTGGADLYAEADESFFRHVQPSVHNANVCPGGRRAYPLHLGAKQNGKGPVQFLGGVNLSRSPNSQVTIAFPTNLWAAATGETENDDLSAPLGAFQLPADTSTIMEVEFVVWNYNVLCYRGGVGGFKFTRKYWGVQTCVYVLFCVEYQYANRQFINYCSNMCVFAYYILQNRATRCKEAMGRPMWICRHAYLHNFKILYYIVKTSYSISHTFKYPFIPIVKMADRVQFVIVENGKKHESYPPDHPEEFRSIPGFTHAISSSGRVYNSKNRKILRTRKESGKFRVSFMYKGKRRSPQIHILVATQFIHNPNPESNPLVGHKDGDNDNNHVSNLFWTNQSKINSRRKLPKFNQGAGRPVVATNIQTNEVMHFKYVREAANWVLSEKLSEGTYTTVYGNIFRAMGLNGTIYAHRWKAKEFEMLEGEKWKSIPIKGCEAWKISNYGRTMGPGKIVRKVKCIHHSEYPSFTINKKYYKNHVVVAKTFIINDDPETKNQVNHKDGNVMNSHVSNLEWCTQSENIQHADDNGLIKRYRKEVQSTHLGTGKKRKHVSLKQAALDLDIPVITVQCGVLKKRPAPYVCKKYGFSFLETEYTE